MQQIGFCHSVPMAMKPTVSSKLKIIFALQNHREWLCVKHLEGHELYRGNPRGYYQCIDLWCSCLTTSF